MLKAAADAGLPVTTAVVWDKQAITVGGPRSLRGTYEMCAVLAKPEFRIRNRSVPDVWRIKTSTRKPHGHPAEKPEALIRAILDVLDLPPGAQVLDPFLGSGTVAAAARAAGLACTGIEAEERWCQAAARRLAVASPAR